MDLDKALVAAILAGGRQALFDAIHSGIQSEFLMGEGRVAFEFVWSYFRQYGQVPNHGILLAKFGIMLEPAPGPIEFFVKEVLQRRVAMQLEQTVTGIGEHLQNKDVDAAYLKAKQQLRIIEKESMVGPRVHNMLSQGQSVIDFYNRIKNGERGIQTPWPTLNEVTLGFWPEDFVLFSARAGIGKSWLLLMILRQAWNDFEDKKKRVLVISTEMTQLRLAMRFYALQLDLNYKDLQHGNLGGVYEKQFFDGVKALMNDERLKIIGGDFDFRLETVEAAIEEANPEAVYLDGVYLIRASGTTKNDQATNVYDELKRVAKRKKIPLICTTQLNRKADANDASSVKNMDKVAQSDAAAWNADIGYALIQTDDMKRNREMILRPLKVREGEAEDLKIHWDIQNRNFGEFTDASTGPGPGSGSASAPVPDGSGPLIPF